MTISSRKRERERLAFPRENVATAANGPQEKGELSQDEHVLTEEARRRAERYAAKLAAALRERGDAR